VNLYFVMLDISAIFSPYFEVVLNRYEIFYKAFHLVQDNAKNSNISLDFYMK